MSNSILFMSGTEFFKIRKFNKVSRIDVANLFKISRTSVWNYEQLELIPSKLIKPFLEHLNLDLRTDEELKEYVSSISAKVRAPKKRRKGIFG